MFSVSLIRRYDSVRGVGNVCRCSVLTDRKVRPLIKMLTGEEANALHMMGVRMKVNSMLNQTVPPAKAALFAIGLTKLFVLEIGPLLTALLLCGRGRPRDSTTSEARASRHLGRPTGWLCQRSSPMVMEKNCPYPRRRRLH